MTPELQRALQSHPVVRLVQEVGRVEEDPGLAHPARRKHRIPHSWGFLQSEAGPAESACDLLGRKRERSCDPWNRPGHHNRGRTKARLPQLLEGPSLENGDPD